MTPSDRDPKHIETYTLLSISEGASFQAHKSHISQWFHYLDTHLLSDVSDKEILALERELNELYKRAKANRWDRRIRINIKDARSKASALGYIIKYERQKRSSDEFYGTLTELAEVLELLLHS